MKTYLIILSVITACSSEPHCSKFHFEEKLLEKMIRTEILVENMKKQMDDIETRVTRTLTKLNEDAAIWKGEIETQQEIGKVNMAKLQEKAKVDFDKNLQAVKDLKDKVMLPNIAFHAKDVRNRSPAAGEAIVFNDIVFNLGESYNTGTGVFTVPLGGIYLFTVQLCIDNGKHIYHGLVVDDIYMDRTLHTDNYGGFVSCYKSSTIVSVKAGNKICVKVKHQSGNILYHDESGYWTSFAGVLIHQD